MQHRIQFISRIVILVIIFLAGFGSAVLYLWNWLMPDIFGLKQITYWQALGLIGLFWLLGMPFMDGSRYANAPRRDHSCRHGLTPEQREKLHQSLESCGEARPGSDSTRSVP